MLKGLSITPPILGRISIGKVVERNGKRLPEKDDAFTITSLKEADLAPFTNLKKVQDIGGFLRPRARTALVKHGIEVED